MNLLCLFRFHKWIPVSISVQDMFLIYGLRPENTEWRACRRCQQIQVRDTTIENAQMALKNLGTQ